jgi:inner membrane protein
MPTVLTHMVAAAAIGTVVPRARLDRRARILGMVCAALPDADVVGYGLGITYGEVLGHRGLTHSVPFATAVATGATLLARPRRRAGLATWLYLFVATASHGVLDAFTNGGLGVAFLAPFSATRWFAPWRPILVSPIGLRRFAESDGAAVLWSELAWVWLPCAIVVGAAWAWRRFMKPRTAMS